MLEYPNFYEYYIRISFYNLRITKLLGFFSIFNLFVIYLDFFLI